ncbi:unnamed protein product, partial [Heligmosomoides polygyrus]|uniref:Aa_trans domain-containing protein n=1 Tax=Heligmosomoides polygyrus TaxID=6339 RepID=A0A183F7F7_HELPZ
AWRKSFDRNKASCNRLIIVRAIGPILQAIWSTLTVFSAREYSALLMVNGGFVLPEIWGRVLLIIFIFLLCHSIILPPCLFVFRYLQICRYDMVSPTFLSVWTCGTLCFAAWPTPSDLKHFAPIAFEINVRRNTTFLVATLHVSSRLTMRLLLRF